MNTCGYYSRLTTIVFSELKVQMLSMVAAIHHLALKHSIQF